MQFNFLLSTGSPAEPLDTTGKTHLVEKHCSTSSVQVNNRCQNQFHLFLQNVEHCSQCTVIMLNEYYVHNKRKQSILNKDDVTGCIRRARIV